MIEGLVLLHQGGRGERKKNPASFLKRGNGARESSRGMGSGRWGEATRVRDTKNAGLGSRLGERVGATV